MVEESNVTGGCVRRTKTSSTRHCERCGYDWIQRDPDSVPQRCPSCRSKRWMGETGSMLTCHHCGHTWRNRVNSPMKCPSCQSHKWGDIQYRLLCHRCGHTWSTREGRTSSDVRICPSCKSPKWMASPDVMFCTLCDRQFTVTTGRTSGKCPSCQGRESIECRCMFCGSKWISPGRRWRVCPFCCSVCSDGSGEIDREVWSEGNKTIRYIIQRDTSVFYLWVDDMPVTTCYLDEVLSYMDMSSSALILRFNDPKYDKMWAFIAKRMMADKDLYLVRVPRYMELLGLNNHDARILSLHDRGMNPGAIALFMDMDTVDVREAFNRIMQAFQSSDTSLENMFRSEGHQGTY